MAQKFIDLDGIAHVWTKMKNLLTGKADTNLGNVTNANFKSKADSAGVGGAPIVTAASSDGVAYTATVNNLTALTNGFQVIIVPNKESTSATPTLNLNGLGAKTIKQSVSAYTSTGVSPKNTNWMVANKPVLLMYDGQYFKTVNSRTNAADIYGTVPVANGGTGLTASPSMLTNLGSTSAANVLQASPRPGITGTLPIANGGTGQTTAAAARNALGLGNTTGALPIANGGTGATTAEQARKNLGIKDIATEGSDYIVETYNNDTEWWRKWKSGWLEQGSTQTVASDTNVTVTLLKPFKDTNYCFNAFPVSSNNYQDNGINVSLLGASVKSTTDITHVYIGRSANAFSFGHQSAGVFQWYACGMGA